MKSIELVNHFPKEYNPQNFYDFLRLACNGTNLPGYVRDIFDIYTSRKQEELIKNIVERLNKLENRDQIMDCFKSNEMNDLMHYAFIKSTLCHKIEQIKKMADIIIAALENDKISHDDAEVLINIVSEMNTAEAEAFFDIYNNIIKNKVDDINFEKEEFSIDVFSNKKYISLIDNIVSKGLLKKIIYKSNAFWDGGSKLADERYNYTYYGVLFLKIIYNEDINMK